MAQLAKKPPVNAGDTDACSIPGDREDPLEKEMANPIQYSFLKNPMDRGAHRATVHQVAKSRTQLSTCTLTHTQFH